MIEHTLKEDILNILRTLSSNDSPTQRDLSHKNHKLNRISYILTTKGFKEKTELTLHFLKRKQEEYENLRREWENLEGALSQERGLP